MSVPIVTVVIPTRNRRPLLAQALKSVLDQTLAQAEVVVVDEASEDDTEEFLGGVADHRLRVLRHTRPKGLAAARNAGLNIARGEWTAFLDDDDLFAPDKLRSQLDAVRAHRGAGWSTGGSVRVDADLHILGWHRLERTDNLLRDLLQENMIPGSGSGVMANTSLLRDLGGFREDLPSAQDWDCWIRLAMAAPLAVVDRPVSAYRIWPASMSHRIGDERAAISQIQAMHEHLAAELGLEPPDPTDMDRFLARQAFYAGHRGSAVHQFMKLSRRQPRFLLSAAAAAAMPRHLALAAQRRQSRMGEHRIPQTWRPEAEAWLASHRGSAQTAARPPRRKVGQVRGAAAIL